MPTQLPLLVQVESYLQERIAPQAIQLDQEADALFAALKGLGERAWLALRVPENHGGPGLDEVSFRAFQELVARYSGALAFLQTQHQSAAAMLAHSPNRDLQQMYLPRLSSGQTLIGVGFSQLRRGGDPLMKAIAVDGGYQLTGEVSWITGWGCFQHFIIGAMLPDGRAVFGLMPFCETVQSGGGAIALSEPMQLAAMSSTNTVKALVQDWVLLESRVVSVQPVGWIQQSDRHNVLHHSFFALGCARAGLDQVEAMLANLPGFAERAWRSLDRELTDCRDRIYAAHQGEAGGDRLQLRAWAIDLAVRCAHAAVTVSRGGANDGHHAAQRIYREALAFTVFGQTTAVMEATLARLVRR